MRETSLLPDPAVRSQCLDQVVDQAGGDAVDVGLHDHRIESLVDPAPAFEQALEEAACPEFGDRQVQVAGLRGQRLVPVSVAQRDACGSVLIPLCADRRGGLGLDQLLQHPLGHRPDEFEPVART